MIPLYTYPGSTWDAVVTAKTSYPSVPIIAIINPNNGPGSSQDPNYVQGIQNLRSNGVVVLGYVYTSYGSRAVSSVEADINSYKNWYTIDGIMFDEMSNVAGFESYYSNLTSYTNSLGLSLTVGNPGTSTLSSYVGTVNILIIYEDVGLPSLSILSSSDMGYGKQNFGMVAYGVASLDTSFETNATNYVSYEYITDANLPNPYDTLPSYFTNLVATLNTASPPPQPPSTTIPLTVNSVDLNGNPITGLWTTVQSNGTTLATGYTPFTYNASTGTKYTVTVANYGSYTFSHWEDGSTNSARTITPTQATTLTAYYKTAVTLTVKAAVTNSNKSPSCVSVLIKYQSNAVASGCAPLTYSAAANSTYGVTVSTTGPFTFSGWSTGSTSNPITVTVGGSSSITAYFRYIKHYTSSVTFQTSSNGGSINFNGTTYTNGGSGNYSAGTASAVATPPANYAFGGWSASGGLLVEDSSSNPTHVSVTGPGTLIANFRPNTPNAISPATILAAGVSIFAVAVIRRQKPTSR
jgi:spherulation-specific family 4 protein/List-Bact-rpt repeat protein